MDPMFLSYSQVNGVPQESKLATYMRQNKGPPLSAVGMTSLVKNVSSLSLDPLSNLPMKKENVGGTTYYYPAAVSAAAVTVDRVGVGGGGVAGGGVGPSGATGVDEGGAGPVLHATPLTAYPGGTPHHLMPADSSYSVSDEIRLELQMKNALTLAQPDPAQYPNLPTEVENYHELCPLEQLPSLHKAQLIGYQTSTYKATNIKTGSRYCLRRIHGFRLPNQKCTMIIDMWKKLSHSNIVQLRDVFTTKAFEDHSLVFVYDYHPDSGTLLARHFSQSEPLNGYTDPFSSNPNAPRPYSHQKNALLRQQHSNSMLSESTIWSYVIQLTGALRVIHAAGLACRSLDPSKVLLTARSRIRISCCGISDILTFDSTAANPLALMPHYQQEDLTALGKLVLALSCRSLMAVQRENLQTSLDLMGRSYSNDLKHLIMYLLSQQRRSIVELMPMIGARYYSQLDTIQMHNDHLENELSKEMENGRLMRLMVKLGIINERPELNLDPTWAETGDRYMVKLFRDYLFHQVTEDGRPWLDMAHIVHCLNKLDSGSQEKICLMSRDEQCILVVTYEELKHCLEQSFEEIVNVAGAAKSDVNP